MVRSDDDWRRVEAINREEGQVGALDGFVFSPQVGIVGEVLDKFTVLPESLDGRVRLPLLDGDGEPNEREKGGMPGLAYAQTLDKVMAAQVMTQNGPDLWEVERVDDGLRRSHPIW